MPRVIDSAVVAATESANVIVAAAVKLEMIGGTVFANTTPYSIKIGDDIYPGVGVLGRVSTIQESVENRAFDATIELSGVQPADVALALGSGYRNQPATIFALFFDKNHQLVGAPLPVFKGLMDVMVIKLDTTATISLTVSNRLADWDRPRIRRYTDEDQQDAFPGDLGCAFVAGLQDKTIIWGLKVTS